MTDGLPRVDGVSTPAPRPRRWWLWVAGPAGLGVLAGLTVTVVPWARHLLGFVLIISGLAWLLRVASDWFAERVGPQRGVVVLGSILFGTWLVLAIAAPEPLRRLGFGGIRLRTTDRDPYDLPPAGSKTLIQAIQQPSTEPLDPVTPLKELVQPIDDPETATGPQSAPADGARVAATSTLRLSSSTSVAGAAIVLIAEVRGDGRPVRGTIDFAVDNRVVASVPLRVQGSGSQAEHRLVGLQPGLHAVRAFYRGSRSFTPGQSDALQHRVTAR